MSGTSLPAGRGLAAAVAVFGLRLATDPAAAQEAAEAGAGPARDPVVDVVIAATPEEAATLERALRELADRVGVRLRWMRVEWFELSAVVVPDAAAPPAAARAWFDLVGVSRRPGEPPGARAALYLADSAWDRVLVRDVPVADGVDEVTREELAHIFEAGVEGILAGAAPGRPREEVREALGIAAPEPPPVDPPPEPPPRPPSETPPVEPAPGLPWTLEPCLDWGLLGLSGDNVVATGPGLGLGLGAGGEGFRLGLSLWGGYRLPVRVAGDGVGVRLDHGMLRLLVAAEIGLDDAFALQFALGGGLDVVRVEPQAAGIESVRLEPLSHAVKGVVSASVALRLRIAGPLSLWLGVGVDVDPSPDRYVLLRDGGSVTVMDSWAARPVAFLRVSFEAPIGGAPTTAP